MCALIKIGSAVVLAAGLFCGSAQAMCNLDLPRDMLLTPADHQRLGAMYQSRALGLAGSLRSASAKDRELIANLVAAMDDASKSAHPLPSVSQLQGNYRCQVMKLGRLADLVIYSPFRCRIDTLDGTAAIEKLSGSQRFTGTLVPLGGGFVYAGAGHYDNEKPRDYGVDPDRDQTGCMLPVNGVDRMVLELPRPKYDSDHDLILFTRTGD